MRLAFIGAGKVGSTLARVWQQAGITITAVASQTHAHAEELAQQVNAQAFTDPLAVIPLADIVFLTVPDDVIEPVATTLATADWTGTALVHTSGAASLDKLQAVADRGAQVGSLHPAFPFADVATAIANIQGATFAIEASHDLLQQRLVQLVHLLDGHEIIIPVGGKAQYHAALVIASNYTVTLYAAAEQLLLGLGADKTTANHALNTLLAATLANLQARGIPDALTGPLTRADVGTIQAHLDILEDEALKALYIGLARLSYPMLQQRDVDIARIEKILGVHDE